MGTQLTGIEPSRSSSRQIIPWLDHQTDALIQDMIATMAAARHDLICVILYGSLARREERSLGSASPSDVDLLFVFDVAPDRCVDLMDLSLTHTLGLARNRHLEAPREVQVMFASRTLDEWDPTFVANVARDGRLLFLHGPLPEPLVGVQPIMAPAG